MDKPSKITFFDNLYALHDGVTDPDEDECAPFAPFIAAQKTPNPGQGSASSSNSNSNSKLRDTRLRKRNSLKLVSTQGNIVTSTPAEPRELITPTTEVVPSKPKLSEAFRFKYEEKTSRSSTRRTSTSTSTPVQKSDIFADMYFYFVPNNIKNITRKLKIQRAHEHGAFCISGSFSETQQAVTHIIADSGFKYSDILQAIGQESIPDHIIIVKDNFPSDCIQFRRILDHKQYMYLVPGRPIAAPKQAQIPQDVIPRNISSESSSSIATPKFHKEIIKETPRNPLTDTYDTPETPGSVIQPPGSPDVIKATTIPNPNPKRKRPTDVITTPSPNIVKETPLLRNRPRFQFTEVVKETPIKGNSYYTHLAGSTPPFGNFDHLDDCENDFDTTATAPSAASAAPKPQDDLDRIIATATQLPFSDSEDVDRDTEDEDSYENHRKKSRTSVGNMKKTKGGLLSFQCMHPNLVGAAEPADDVGTREVMADASKGNGEGPNERIIKVLSELESHYTIHNDHFRALSYRKAISSIRRHPHPLHTASAALKLPSIGPSLAAKIEEIASTGNLHKLDTTKNTSEDKALKLFLGIYGVGPKKAREWVLKGYTTLEEVREKEKLSEAQKVGVERHADFATRIPREEVKEHGKVVEEVAREIDKDLVLEVMGSYRRGAKTCGDIDIMITKEGAEGRYMKLVLDKIVERLTERGFLKVALAASKGDDAAEGSKWYGASQLSPDLPWRRIDFLVVPWVERGAALLYFTGSDVFNRSMRLLASKKGYALNQRGLYSDVIRGPKRQKLVEGTLVEGESEQKIFEILGIPYRPPEERNA
ncbi:hypothetical protein BZA77DRAFT_303463 [Pyronema omphalodes]|nr:hypothetical protein BZA77DRAFT_303463 [Pyronema omphalodes]